MADGNRMKATSAIQMEVLGSRTKPRLATGLPRNSRLNSVKRQKARCSCDGQSSKGTMGRLRFQPADVIRADFALRRIRRQLTIRTHTARLEATGGLFHPKTNPAEGGRYRTDTGDERLNPDLSIACIPIRPAQANPVGVSYTERGTARAVPKLSGDLFPSALTNPARLSEALH